jgi:hypothetical protein
MEKTQSHIEAIQTLRTLEQEHCGATAEEQQVLSQYVGWGGLADAFDPSKENWSAEYTQLKGLLTEDEYAAARASTLNAHYTSPVVIRAIYDAVEKMGFQSGNILEPSMGVGNFFGMLPDSMTSSRLYGVELDSITGRIAQKLYPQANITVAGFETTDRRDFYDLAVGNVPFGQYKVSDKAYNKLGFSMGIRSLSAYIRKMALDGYCLNLDLPQLRRMAYLLQNCSNNLNQVAKRVNESGKIYAADLADLRTRLDELIDIGKQILSKLAEL